MKARGFVATAAMVVATVVGSAVPASGVTAPCGAEGQTTCENYVVITDHAPGVFGAPWMVEDQESKNGVPLPPGKNATMALVNIFMLGSVNPVCSLAIKTATTGYMQPEACLGDTPNPNLDATGGHPVLALYDAKAGKWVTLTPQLIEMAQMMQNAGFTQHDLYALKRFLTRRGM